MVMRSTDRILVLERIDPKSKDVGLMDPKVFEGKNNLHAVLDPAAMWYLRYERGNVPTPLRQKFTSFNALKDFTSTYLNTKNIKIVEILD